MPRPEADRFRAASRRRAGAALLPAALAAAMAAPIAAAEAADPDPARLEDVERQLEQESGRIGELDSRAQDLAAQVATLQQELIAAARAAQDSEQQMSQIEATLVALEAEARDAETELHARRGQLAAILGALQRLALQPPEAMLLGPATPLDTVRGATLLKVALPAVEGRARDLKRELESLRALQAEIDERRRALAEAAARLAAEREALAVLLEQKRTLQQSTEAERAALADRVALLGRQAADLKELMAQLASPPPPVPAAKPAMPGIDSNAVAGSETVDPPPAGAQPAALTRLDRPTGIRAFPAVQASLVMPARGRVVGRFGDGEAAGPAGKGVVIATRPAAQVVAPFDGQVVFQGPFRGYGEILILEHAGGYHTLLAGIGRADAVVGQWLLAGEPVGVMAAATGDDPATSPELYVELRHDGQPINPLPWLDIRDSKIE